MFKRHFRLCFNVLLLIFLLVGCWFVYCARANAEAKQSDKVRELQEQRLEILRNLVKEMTVDYKSGHTSADELRTATRARDEAELDLCASNKERIAVLERVVGEAREREEQSRKMAAEKMLPESSLLKATADRLQQEILLEKATTN